METAITFTIFLGLIALLALPYWLKARRRQQHAADTHRKSAGANLLEPATLHPRIDALTCIGCGSCVRACPEDVLGIVEGRAAIVNGARCVSHGVCLEACPVGAITLGFGRPKQGMEIPYYDDDLQTNIPGLYIVGELGGIGLIKNAFDQGIRAVEHIAAQRLPVSSDRYDLAIIGGGPAGIGSALAAQARGLRYIVLEQYELGGSLLHYPREKVVLTSPVELPLYGKLRHSEIGKEELLLLFEGIAREFKLRVITQEKVEQVIPDAEFSIRTAGSTYRATKVILATGRRGSPKKLNVPGENLPKVLYRLIESESYHDQRILVVGGGDSAVEAAVGLARQKGNEVVLSYRREGFIRLKEKNTRNIEEMMKSGELRVMFESEVIEIQRENVLVRERGNVLRTLGNDHVFIFAGGELPSEFLKKTGVRLRTADSESRAA